MFRHPLYIDELHKFLRVEISRNHLSRLLNNMVREERIFFSHNMYSLENSGQIFLKRLVGADVAAEKMKEARRCARLIAGFPFVKSVCISGSLSKGYADEKSDIDFFIITSGKRLWISRTLLHLFKKFTFLVGKEHSFCMNYFIDESELCLEEQNIFTATELSTLIPAYNSDIYRKLLNQNITWMQEHFPNLQIQNDDVHVAGKRNMLKKSLEWTFNKLWPEHVNGFLMRLTDKLWRYKWERKNYPAEDYDIAMKTKWYVSKQHPLNYQKKVLEFNASQLQLK